MRSRSKFADTDWVDNLTGPAPLDQPPVPKRTERAGTIYESSLDLASGAKVEEVEFTSSMMGLFD